jgi:hypothetical protein
MRRLGGIVAWAGALAALARTARAEPDVTLQSEVTTSLGLTDNAANTPSPPENDPTAPRPIGDGFGVVSPTLGVVIETRRATHRVRLGGAYAFFVEHHDVSSTSGSLGWTARWLASTTTTALFGASAAVSTLGQFDRLGAAVDTTGDGNPGGDDLLAAASITQGVERALSRRWSVRESLGAQVGQLVRADTGDGRTLASSLALGAVRGFERSEFELLASTDALVSDDANAHSVGIVHRAGARFEHALARGLRAEVGGGGLVGYDPTTEHGAVGQPFARGLIAFDDGARGEVSLAVAHDVQPNLVLGQLVASDAATVRALALFGASGLDLGGSISGRVAHAFLAEGGVGPASYGLTLDLALGYAVRDTGVRAELRFQSVVQDAPDDSRERLAFPTLARRTGMLTLTYAYPAPPARGGRGRIDVVPPPTLDPDLLARRIPPSERALDEAERRGEGEGADDAEDPRP